MDTLWIMPVYLLSPPEMKWNHAPQCLRSAAMTTIRCSTAHSPTVSQRQPPNGSTGMCAQPCGDTLPTRPCPKGALADNSYRGIRPAFGYPSLPDQSLIFIADKVLDYASMDITLTENGAMHPAASTSGLLFAHPGEPLLCGRTCRRRAPVGLCLPPWSCSRRAVAFPSGSVTLSNSKRKYPGYSLHIGLQPG